ncbi:DnaQ DNA polymerase III, epsilon subunit and related 3'-5' exonucleases [uncultured Caudovirales phage]|uniref:DnaQ DNA polymerase III, epsilon subunit and related 3'-5' exonucleases n=1 Tax=uncultured Caudovirales phage TaxID=2100421 RepID=A0A6J5KZH8_9CAUD|nr:DnaQ DNA polymerase III, epsilon subunit and related 3'-5' exonucleases [uncultured Caudovirales phage]
MITKIGQPIIAFDLETTGTDPERDRIVQLYAVQVDEHYRPIGEAKKTLINPQMSISPDASRIHGITDMDVANKPPFVQFAKALLNFFGDAVVIAYNGQRFDVPMLSKEFERCGLVWPTQRTVIVDPYTIFKKQESRNLAAAVKFYTGEEFTDGHDADRDVQAMLKVFRAQMSKYTELNNMTAESLQLYCNNGVRYLDVARKIYLNEQNVACFAFGKEKDKPVATNRKYAEWVIFQSELPVNTRNVVRQLIGA